MKLTCVFASLLGATIGVGYGGLGMVAHAQGVPAIQSTTPTVQQIIPLKNVAPNLVAWWLDPAHNEEPVQITGSESLKHKAMTVPPGQPQAKTTGSIELPTGITRVSPIVAQNALLVVGTAEAIQKLQQTVVFLDRPLRQVEVEVQFVTLDEFGEKAFGLEFGKDKPEGLAVNFVRGNMNRILTELINQNKAKIITAPRVTAINNMTATLRGWQLGPFRVGIKKQDGTFQELSDPAAAVNAHLLLGTSSRLKVTPTINNDDTVTLQMLFEQVLELSSEVNGKPTEIPNSGGLSSIANVRDGDTIALRGVTPQFFRPLENGKKATTPNLLMLVTARIIRRVGDDIQPVALQR